MKKEVEKMKDYFKHADEAEAHAET